jgi:hypothetical protein
MKVSFVILVFILSPHYLLCQTISGKIINVDGEMIPFASIVIKDSINAPAIKEYVLARNGYYSINLKKLYQKAVIEVSATKYLKEVYVIANPEAGRSYQHDFSLVKDTVVKLPDVTVKAKVRPFQISGDTVKYNLSAYTDGSERKIQDVIKKLPGIQVNEKTGEIKYKGTPVETVKLDGEDLFSSNYTIGTKNINVDMVEQVQAIENYSDNPLLKGIEHGDKVVLNLTLKKKKADYSGSINAGWGLLNSRKAGTDAAVNFLGISSKYKSFATFSYNNIGIDNTPYDYFSYSPNIEQLKEADFLAKRYIPETYFDIALASNRININHSLFNSYNSVFKIGKRLSIKTNFCFLNDRINSSQNYSNTNSINGQEFITSDKYNITKRPKQYRADLEVKYSTSAKSLLEYKIKYRKEQISTSADVLQNDANNYKTKLTTQDDLIVQTLTYTQKFGENKVLQLTGRQSVNKVPQRNSFLPAIYDPANFMSDDQFSRFRKNNLNIQANFLGSAFKSKYSVIFGADFDDNYFSSALNGTTSSNSDPIAGFGNNFLYKKVNTFISLNYRFQVKRWRFMPSFTGKYLKQELQNFVSDKIYHKGDYLVESTFSIGYKISNYSTLLFTSGYKQRPFTEDYFVANPVYISNRLLRSNELGLFIQKSKFSGFFYIINDLYRQFQLNFGGNYSESKGNYFSNLTLQQNSTRMLYLFLPGGNRTVTANFMIEKYIPFLESTIRLNSEYSALFYNNIVNNSSLRSNVSKILISHIFFKTAFDGRINLENIFRHRLVTSNRENGVTFSNQSFNDNFQVIVKPGKHIFLLASADYYLPDSRHVRINYLFLDVSVNLSTKKKIWDWRFSAKNINNNKTFMQVETNDFSKTSFQTNLQSRYFMISCTRYF